MSRCPDPITADEIGRRIAAGLCPTCGLGFDVPHSPVVCGRRNGNPRAQVLLSISPNGPAIRDIFLKWIDEEDSPVEDLVMRVEAVERDRCARIAEDEAEMYRPIESSIGAYRTASWIARKIRSGE